MLVVSKEISKTFELIHEKLYHGRFDAAERAQIYAEANELLFKDKVPPENSKLNAKTCRELESRYPELTTYLISGKLISVRWC